jgi:hypothetical protein
MMMINSMRNAIAKQAKMTALETAPTSSMMNRTPLGQSEAWCFSSMYVTTAPSTRPTTANVP